MPDPELGAMLRDAIGLLENLDGRRSRITECQMLAASWAAEHPEISVDLLVTEPPASASVEYDLLVGHPSGGTVALSFRRDGGDPWLVSYSDHWAANYVVSVNDQNITIQQVLRDLELAAERDPSLMRSIVDQVLLAQAVEPGDRAIDGADVQSAIDRLRVALGLTRSADLNRWLAERRLSRLDLVSIMAGTLITRKAKRRIAKLGVREYFEYHPAKCARVTMARAVTASQATATALLTNGRVQGLLPAVHMHLIHAMDDSVKTHVDTEFAGNLRAAVMDAPIMELVGPFETDEGLELAQVLARREARMDAETEAFLEERAFAEWLDVQRAAASIRWHWIA